MVRSSRANFQSLAFPTGNDVITGFPGPKPLSSHRYLRNERNVRICVRDHLRTCQKLTRSFMKRKQI